MTVQDSLSPAEKVHAGDVEAFARIFDQYHARIYRYLRSLVRDADQAEDLAQDTFVKAYKALCREAPPQNLSAWLYTIATNTALSALRRRRIISWLPLHGNAEAEEKPSTRDPETQTGERDLIARAMAKLPRADAACMLLRFQQGLEYPELAEVLGTTVPAAKMRLSRARAAFREAYLVLAEEARR